MNAYILLKPFETATDWLYTHINSINLLRKEQHPAIYRCKFYYLVTFSSIGKRKGAAYGYFYIKTFRSTVS